MTFIQSMSPSSDILKTSRAKLHQLAEHTRRPSLSAIHPRRRQNSESSECSTSTTESDASSIANGDGIDISSGRARTHACLLDTVTVSGPRLTHKDLFLCQDAVDLVKLLYLSRRSLYAAAKESGGSVLLNEQYVLSPIQEIIFCLLVRPYRWRCRISRPKFKKQDRFRVKVS